MQRKISFSSPFLIFGIPLTLLVTSLFLALNLPKFGSDSSALAQGLTLDFVLTVPIVYFLLIRKTKISKFTVMPFFIGGLVIATFIIPESNHQTLDLVKKWLLPVVELTVLTIIITQVVRIRRAYREEAATQPDFTTALKESTAQILPPKLAFILTTEISMVYYALFAWKKPRYTANQFSYHKESGILVVLWILFAVALIELFAVHLLLHNYNPVLAWILSGISLYGVFQILGLIKSIPRTPILLDGNQLTIRMGMIKETRIHLDEIERVELTTNDYPKEDSSYQNMTLVGYNCILHLKPGKEGVIHGLFGLQKKYQHLVIAVDEVNELKKRIVREA